ncbi:DUF6527 family protein [Cupriavidus basilensis]
MSALSKVLQDSPGNGFSFWCPGCDGPHRIQHGAGAGPRWGWNGDVERATFTPSVLVRYPHWEPSAEDPAVRTAIALGEVTQQLVERVCHSFVTDGRIQFLGDCTHALAGQTVPMVEFPEGWGC